MILHNTKYLQLKSVETNSGKDWVYAHRPNVSDVVVILPIINDDKILFITEKRPPIISEYGEHYTVGLPAGLVGDVRNNESVEDAIKAELLEETGLIADSIKIVAKNIASSAGCISETYTIAIAHISKYKIVQEPIDDEGIILDRFIVNITDIQKWLKEKEAQGMFLTSQMLSALYYLDKEIIL